jgi:hypothetical protein
MGLLEEYELKAQNEKSFKSSEGKDNHFEEGFLEMLDHHVVNKTKMDL